MCRIIREVRPDYVVAENVLGILSISAGMVFEQVCLDLEDAGYEVQAVVAPACGVDAPHRRDRVWFVAYSKGNHDGRIARGIREAQRGQVGRLLPAFGEPNNGLRGEGDAPHTTGDIGRCEPQQSFGDGRTEGNQPFGSGSKNGYCHPATFQIRGTHAHPAGKQGEPSRLEQPNFGRPQSGQLGGNDSPGSGIKLYDFRRFPSESPVRRNDDGISDRLDIGAFFEGFGKLTSGKWAKESIAALGNAIVPQVALQIFKSIIDTENKLK